MGSWLAAKILTEVSCFCYEGCLVLLGLLSMNPCVAARGYVPIVSATILYPVAKLLYARNGPKVINPTVMLLITLFALVCDAFFAVLAAINFFLAAFDDTCNDSNALFNLPGFGAYSCPHYYAWEVLVLACAKIVFACLALSGSTMKQI